MKTLTIRKAVVLGAGTMGASIAALLAGNGIKVALLDIPAKDGGPKSGPALAGLKRILDPKSRLLYAPSAGELISAGNFEDDLGEVADADWVLEAIVEKLEPKVELFGKVAKLAKETCILSSNTSGISMEAIASSLPDALKKRFIGTHFFNPPRYMKLLELIPTSVTPKELLDSFADFSERRLGKSVIVARDTPSFIANRIGNANAMFLYWAMEKYDLPVSTVNFLAGPLIGRAPALRTFDLVGLDVVKASCDTNYGAEQDPHEKALMKSPEFFEDLINRGHLGDKSGKGFYKKEGGQLFMWDRHAKDYIPAQEPELAPLAGMDKKKTPMKEQVYAILNSGTPEGEFLWFLLCELFSYTANRAPEITDDFKKIDLAMQLGYNWRFGPFQLWEALGAEEIVSRMEKSGKALAPWVKEHLAKNGGNFYDKTGFASLVPARLSVTDPALPVVWESDEIVLKDLGDGIGAVVIVTPHSTIGTKASASMIKAVKKAEELFNGAIITSAGKNFCVGADLNDMLQACLAGEFEQLTKNTIQFQEMTQVVKYASIPFVAAVFRNVMGGGCELCMQAHKVVSHSELTIGLVEPQVGLIPSGGGLKELVLRGAAIEKRHSELYMLPFLEQYVSLISDCKVSKSALHAKEMGLLKETDRIVPKLEMLIEAAKEEALLLSKSFVPLQKTSVKVFGTTGFASISAKRNNLLYGGFVTEYDKVISDKVASVVTGGEVPNGTVLHEDALLALECKAFIDLCKQKKTQERMDGLLKTGKAIRN